MTGAHYQKAGGALQAIQKSYRLYAKALYDDTSNTITRKIDELPDVVCKLGVSVPERILSATRTAITDRKAYSSFHAELLDRLLEGIGREEFVRRKTATNISAKS